MAPELDSSLRQKPIFQPRPVMGRSLTLVRENLETAPTLGMCGGLDYQCSPTVLDTGTCAQVMALLGRFGRYGLVGGSMLLEAGSESLKTQCHSKFTLYHSLFHGCNSRREPSAPVSMPTT